MTEQILLHPTCFSSIAQLHLILSYPCVLEVSDNYRKQTLRNRAYIYGANGEQTLNLPIKHIEGENGRQLFKDVKVENHSPRQHLYWKSLEAACHTSPYFEYYEDDLVHIFEKPYTYLLDINVDAIETILAYLLANINSDKTSTYEAQPETVKGYRYLSNAKREVNIIMELYHQIFPDKHDSIKNLSVLDLLFHRGPDTLDYLSNVSISMINL